MVDEFLDELQAGGHGDFLANPMTDDARQFNRALEEQGVIRRLGTVPSPISDRPYVHYEIVRPIRENAWTYRLVAPVDDAAPTAARFIHETNGAAQQIIDRVKESVQQNWGRFEQVRLTPELERQLSTFAAESNRRMTISRAVAIQYGQIVRDFALHNYGERYGLDLFLGYIWPYQFWHSRTYSKFLQRLAWNPGMIAN